MSASIPVASWNAWRRFLHRSAAISKGIAILLVTAVSLRFSIASVQHAFDVSRGNFENPAPRRDPAPSGVASARPAQPAPAEAKGPPPSAAPGGKPRRMTIGVSAGPPRSDVYVNGRKVGQTPFLGDTSCKTGQGIRIEIMPPKGPPLTYVRDCTGGALEISGPPP